MHKRFNFKKADIGKFRDESADKPVSNFSKGCHIIGMTFGQFSLIDLIHSVLKKTGKADVYIATWSAGIKDANQVGWMLKNDLIGRIRLLTDHSYVTRKKQYVGSLEDIFGVENIRCSEIHAKFVIIRNDEYNVTIQTSMNLNANKTCETFVLYENKEICDFHLDFVNHHFDNMNDGFESSSKIVTECLQKYFANLPVKKKKTQKPPDRNWFDL